MASSSLHGITVDQYGCRAITCKQPQISSEESYMNIVSYQVYKQSNNAF